MSLTITQVKSKVTPKMNGTSLAQLDGFEEKCKEAMGNVLLRVDPLETIRSVRIENAVYDHIFSYSFQDDAKGNDCVIDIRPIGARDSADDIMGRYPREFDIKKGRDTFAIEVINGTKTLRLSKRVAGHVTLATMDSLTVDGLVTGSGDIQNLTTNTLEMISGSASVQFGLSGVTGTAAIIIALNTQYDLSTIQDIGALFNWIEFTDASRITSIRFKYGTDSSNYWYNDITHPHDRAAFVSGAFTLQRADWASATKVGTPVSTAIDYLEVSITYSTGAAIANNRIDNITAAKGEAYEAVYYSRYGFKSAAGTYLETPTAGGDYVNIDSYGENIFIYELMRIIIQELGQKAVKQKDAWFMSKLEGQGNVPGMYDLYSEKYPAQTVPVQTTYHDFGYDDVPDEDEIY